MIRWFALVIFLIIGNCSLAKQWHTRSSGWWDDSSSWKNNIPPPNSISDSIYIHHNIKFKHNLYFSKGYFLIDPQAGLCGNYNIQFGIGATIDQYGNLFCDSILIAGATMKTYGPGALLAHSNMTLKGPAPASYSKLPGGYLMVGADYTCNSESGFKQILSSGNSLIQNLQFFPMPFDDNLNIHLPISGFNYRLIFYTLTGTQMYEWEGYTDDGNIMLNTADLPLSSGLIFYKLIIPDAGENSGVLYRVPR